MTCIMYMDVFGRISFILSRVFGVLCLSSSLSVLRYSPAAIFGTIPGAYPSTGPAPHFPLPTGWLLYRMAEDGHIFRPLLLPWALETR